MQIDIAAHIEKLLFLHDSLAIPALGGFTATRTPASADFAGGTVNPPAKTLSFSENLTVDDGILVDELMRAHHISAEDARNIISEFVEKTHQLLGQREIVTLNGVGRLYKNYVQKIQFLPDAANFNTASYGLPPLQFSPIARSREIEKPLEPTQTPATPAKTPESAGALQTTNAPVTVVTTLPQPTSSSNINWGMILSILFLSVALGGGYWYWKKQKAKAQDIEPIAQTETPAQQLKREAAEAAEAPESNEDPETVKEALAKAAAESVAKKTEDARNNLNGKTCILVVATLQDKTNADRLQNILEKEGYDVYYVQKNGHQVGIEFKYSKYVEVQDKIKALQKLTGEQQIWIKKR
jgi:CCDC81-like prokaryotic HU domain 2/CCDC81-like prokaryotic HU domain 1